MDHLFADEKVTSLGTAGAMLWALTDHENSVRDLAAYDSGTDVTTIANHRVYDSFGNLKSETNSAVDCLFGYTGSQLDEATGLQNNLNRWYDAKVGRWLSQDPIGFEGEDANLYRYVGNTPLRYTDPTGEIVPFIVGGVLLAYLLTPAPANAPGPGDSTYIPNDSEAISNGIDAGVTAATGGWRGMAERGLEELTGVPVTIPKKPADLKNLAAKAGKKAFRKFCSKVKRVTNPKHHPNSPSPEPKNVDELFGKAILDDAGNGWAKDADGTIHRFSKPSNNETHWNGSTTGPNPIRQQNIPPEIRKALR